MKNRLARIEELLDECNQSKVIVEYGNLPNNINAIFYK